MDHSVYMYVRVRVCVAYTATTEMLNNNNSWNHNIHITRLNMPYHQYTYFTNNVVERTPGQLNDNIIIFVVALNQGSPGYRNR